MHKVINDPVQGFISIDNTSILDIIDHPLFQRLRRIRQMGVADLVYPGAEHTRFAHSLGAYHLMGKALETLRSKGIEYSAEEKLSLQIAILLHDIGHFPFSHALENSALTKLHHEEMSLAIIDYLNVQFNNKLETAKEIFLGTYPKKWMHQLVSSHLDVDRMDYLVRDSFYSGVAEGVVGLERILQMIDVVDDELVIEEKGIYSVDKFLIARRIMYSQVYYHKTVLGAEKMLGKILQRAKMLHTSGQKIFLLPSLAFFFDNDVTNSDDVNDEMLSQFLLLTDANILSHVQEWTSAEDFILSDLSKRFIQRRLYKSVDLKDQQTESQAKKVFLKKNPSLNEKDLDYYFFHVDLRTKYFKTDDYSIPILLKNGKVVPLEEIEHSFSHRLYDSVHERFLYYYTQ